MSINDFMLFENIHQDFREKSLKCGAVLYLQFKYIESRLVWIQIVFLHWFYQIDFIQRENINAHMFECAWVKFGEILYPGFKDTR